MEATDKKMEDVMGASPALQAEMNALAQKNDRLHESQTVWVARLRSDLSYRPNTREMTGKARYFSVTTLRVGGDQETRESDGASRRWFSAASFLATSGLILAAR